MIQNFNLQRFFITCLTAFAISLGFTATDIYLPSMPSMARYFGVEDDLIQLSVSACFLGSALSGIFAGSFSDHLGRRPLVILGNIFLTSGALICLLTPWAWGLLGGRFLQGIGVGALVVVGFTIIQDMYSEKESAKILALVATAYTLVPALAPVLGGYIEVLFGWKGNFSLIFGVGFILLIFQFFFLKETHEERREGKLSLVPILRNYKLIMSHKSFLAYTSLMPLLLCGEMCYITTLPFYFIDLLKIPAHHYGYYMFFIVGMYPFGAVLTSRLVNKVDLLLLIKIGLVICLTASLIQFLFHFVAPKNVFLISALFGLHQLGMALIFSPSVSRALQMFPSLRGAAASVRSTFVMISAAVGASMAGFFEETHLFSTIGFLCVMSLLPLLVFYYSTRAKEVKKKKDPRF